MNFKIYNEDEKNILKVNIFDKKICNYDCIFCPIGRGLKTEDTQNFNNHDTILREINNIINKNKIDLIFINSMGEALLHDGIKEIITTIKNNNIPVKLLSNGYLLGNKKFIHIANMCDEVIGELKTINENDFHKYQRPIKNYSIETLINNMADFNKQFKGKFILEITILKTINNDENSLSKLKEAITRINPDEIIIEKENNEIFINKYGIDDIEFEKIKKFLIV